MPTDIPAGENRGITSAPADTSPASADDKLTSLTFKFSVFYSGPQMVDHSGHLYLLRLFPLSPRESRPDGPRQDSSNRGTDGDAPHHRTRSRTSGPIQVLLYDHSY